MTSRYAPVKVEYINPFLTAAVKVFRTMLNCELERGTPCLKTDAHPDLEISGIIGMSGTAAGTVVLSLGRDVAMRATEEMLGEKPETLNADVSDAIGELTNMIAGNAKIQLEQFSMSLSIPNVVIGTSFAVEFPRGAAPISIPFMCDWGPVCVDVGLCEQPGGGV